MQINPKAGLTFANGLRSMMRADPDIIMVGEIRDRETAQIAVQAALTGHLVLSTLHTNDAPGAIARLIDMGVEPFLVLARSSCVLAQRLARRLCDCKQEVVLPGDAVRANGYAVDGDVITAYEPAGCARCGGTGYKGRVGLYEVMPVNDEIRRLARDAGVGRRDRRGGGPGGHASAARRGPPEGPRRRDVVRRARPRDGLAARRARSRPKRSRAAGARRLGSRA